MNGDTRSCVDQILNAIEYGHLSIEETERRVQKLLDNEIAKTAEAADMGMVNACQSLLWELKTHGQIPYEDHSERIRAAVEKEYSAWTRHRRRQQLALKLGSVAAVFLLVAGIGISLHWEWFSVNSTPDGQQYVVQGHEITAQMIETAIAEHQGLQTYDVEDMMQLASLLGFEPDVPASLNNEWASKRCTLTFFPYYIQIRVRYINSAENKNDIVLTRYYFSDAENAYLTFEQSADGTHTTLENTDIYLSENEGRRTCVWHDQLTVSNLVGDISEEESLILVKAILGGI